MDRHEEAKNKEPVPDRRSPGYIIHILYNNNLTCILFLNITDKEACRLWTLDGYLLLT